MLTPRRSPANTRWLVPAVLLACIAIANTAAASGIKSERLLAAIIRHTPAPTLVMGGQQMKRAEAAAARIPGADAFWGVGSSMEPLFSTRTAIVVAPVNFKDLEKGMTVVYVS